MHNDAGRAYIAWVVGFGNLMLLGIGIESSDYDFIMCSEMVDSVYEHGLILSNDSV